MARVCRASNIGLCLKFFGVASIDQFKCRRIAVPNKGSMRFGGRAELRCREGSGKVAGALR